MEKKQNDKEWFKSKTLWANLLVVVGGILTTIGGELETGGTLTAIGVLNIILRYLTDSKIK